MKKFFIVLVFGLFFTSAIAGAENSQGNKIMKISLTFDNKTVIINMEDNSAARQLIEMLPATFEFIDFAGKEKITELPKAVSLSEVHRGMIASKGKMFIYVPWGNLGIFYKDNGNIIDKSLIELGEVEDGLEYLQNQKSGFNAQMQIAE